MNEIWWLHLLQYGVSSFHKRFLLIWKESFQAWLGPHGVHDQSSGLPNKHQTCEGSLTLWVTLRDPKPDPHLIISLRGFCNSDLREAIRNAGKAKTKRSRKKAKTLEGGRQSGMFMLPMQYTNPEKVVLSVLPYRDLSSCCRPWFFSTHNTSSLDKGPFKFKAAAESTGLYLDPCNVISLL